MMNFETAVFIILQKEGGLVNHPKDPGGITKYGISLRAYPHLGTEGIRNLTVDDAKKIYKRDYWDYLKCDKLPDELRLMTFDCGVNQGVGFAVKALQSAIGVTADGKLGPQTLTAAGRACRDRATSKKTIHRFALNRTLRYMQNKNFNSFGEGWMSRLLEITIETLED